MEEQATFNKYLSNLITEAEFRGARVELIELQNLKNFSIQIQNKFAPLLTCPTCHKKSDKFNNLDRQCFRCDCDSCGTEWGKRICVKCCGHYPYIQLSDLNTLNQLNEQAVGWIDRVLGRNTLAVPSLHATKKFICPQCGHHT